MSVNEEGDIALLFRIWHYGPWTIGHMDQLPEEMFNPLIEIFKTPDQKVLDDLGGRVQVKRFHIHDLGNLILKHYARGGAMRHFNKRTYFRWGKSRARIEFEYLLKAKKCGVKTPKPVAYILFGRLFYRAALVLEEIPDTQTLVEVSRLQGAAKRFMDRVHSGIKLLVKNRIHHVDLHPGNILVSATGEVYFIDFDKAVTWTGDHNLLLKKYISRWNRAIKKYDLEQWMLLDF